ncbi:hypothetical protein [Desulfitobacterium hafniense]|uniref:hypothetical protein n=1 Tax=Desulfitobacterium hafniense TaxID=49338 RepID=UPI0003759D3E|nr:hypothetical protein [Desulfitobacterium hafniense]
MNRKLKKALPAAFQAPPPRGRETFLKQLPYPKITHQEFLLDQLRYIRKRIWAASALLVGLGWMVAFPWAALPAWNPDGTALWSLSAALPFLAMITMTEIHRSAAYRMAELEGSCRFSLPQIVIARMSILGVVNFLVLLLVLMFINQVSAYSLLQTIPYTMVPYLMVCALCLWLLNRIPGSEGIYACAAAAGLVSLISFLCETMAQPLYSPAFLKGWLTLWAGCLVLVGCQLHQLVKQLEAKQWNLYLTE